MSDFQDYVDMMSNLTEAQLLAFVEKKGNQRKRAVFDFTKLQTSEAKNSGDMVNKLENSVIAAGQNISLSDKVASQRKIREGVIDGLIKEVDVEMAEHSTKEKELREGVHNLKVQLDALVAPFNKKNTEKLDKYFENERTESLVEGIELFVASLRCVKKASNVDVELYLKDHTKLIWKMKQAKCDTAVYDNVNETQQRLEKIMKDVFKNKSHEHNKICQEYTHFIEWAIQFCKYGLQFLMMDYEVKKIAGLQKRKQSLMDEKHLITSINDQSKTLGLDEFYASTVTNMRKRIEMLNDIQETDYNQALKLQQQNFGFEKNYFKTFIQNIDDIKASNITVEAGQTKTKPRTASQLLGKDGRKRTSSATKKATPAQEQQTAGLFDNLGRFFQGQPQQ